MARFSKKLLAICCSAIIAGNIAVIASAYQSTATWGTYIDFWTDTLSSDIEETDNDSLSHVKWTGKEVTGDFKLKFTIQSENGTDVCEQTYVNSATKLGKVVSIDSNCINGRNYTLVAARENILDPSVYCSGDWEP